MYSFLSRYGQLLGLGLGIFVTLLFFLMIAIGGDTMEAIANDTELDDKGKVAALADSGIFNIGIFGAIALTIIGALLMLGFGIFGIIQDFKGSIKSLIGFGALLLIFIIGYAIAGADGEGVINAITKNNKDVADTSMSFVTEGRSRFISGSLITTMALGGLAFVGLIASEVMNLFR